MTGFFWHFFIYIILFLFLVIMAYRILSILRMPVHLRWELAPVLHDKERYRYGGSYLEEYEWWGKERHKSYLPVIAYMAGEILLMKGVWKNNRSLWPFSFTLHYGIYLVIISVILHFINAMFIVSGTPAAVMDVFRGIAAVIGIVGYIIGSIGAVGLMFKRYLDRNYRAYSSFSAYFKLIFLAAIFISGIIAWVSSVNYATEMSVFTRDLFTLDSGITATGALAAHIIITSVFVLYLPFTDMVHFITKFFTYHSVRWDDEPQDEKMVKKLRDLIAQPLTWSGPHVKSDRGNSWGDMVQKENGKE
ncbi:MAG: respiratory nitrate reductase subunit gamma [Dehalococcoidales bacterium]|nr:respiratory nitrate reductase subunit gamma [Dehalococcoidales bacterium]